MMRRAARKTKQLVSRNDRQRRALFPLLHIYRNLLVY